MIRAVLFDFGGVLTETCWDRDYMARIIEQTFQELGVCIGKNFYDEFMRALDEAWARVVKTLIEERMEDIILDAVTRAGGRVDIGVIRAAVERIKDAPFCKVRKESKKVLKTLRDLGLKTGVVSNSPVNFHENVLSRSGLRKYIDVVVVSCDVGYRKPDPRIFKIALEALGVEPHEAIYVGDVPQIDVPGAKKLGMITVLMSSPEPVIEYLQLPRPKDPVEPDYIIDELIELIDIVLRLMNKRGSDG